jgi:hypothetical protein
MVCGSKSTGRVQYTVFSISKAHKGYRAGHLMNEVSVNEKYIGAILDLSYNVGIPHFIK